MTSRNPSARRFLGELVAVMAVALPWILLLYFSGWRPLLYPLGGLALFMVLWSAAEFSRTKGWSTAIRATAVCRAAAIRSEAKLSPKGLLWSREFGIEEGTPSEIAEEYLVRCSFCGEITVPTEEVMICDNCGETIEIGLRSETHWKMTPQRALGVTWKQ